MSPVRKGSDSKQGTFLSLIMKLDSVIVNIDLACLLGGMESAAILQHFRYWTNINASDPNTFKDGRVWVFASRKSIQNVFPCITDQRIRTILDKLVEGGYLIKGEYSLSMTSKATWYSLSDTAKSLFDGGLAPLVKSTNGLVKSTNDINNNNKKEYTIEEKQAILREKCEPYVDKYGREMIEAFLNYWGQVNGNLILCEIAKRKAGAFDIPRRLATWAQNNYGKPNGPKPQAVRPTQQSKPSRPIWEEMGLTYEQYEKVVLKK